MASSSSGGLSRRSHGFSDDEVDEDSPLLGVGYSTPVGIVNGGDHGHVPVYSSECADRLPPQVDPMKLLNAKYQSLDYDTCENTPYIQEELKKGYRDVLKKQFMRWWVMFWIGVLTGLIACTIDYCIRVIAQVKYSMIKKYFDECYSGNCLYIPLLLWLSFNAVTVGIAACLVTFLEPVAAGSGIPQIKCFLNGIKIPHVVRLRTLVCKVTGVILSVVGGLAIGKEGPMIHSGSVVAAGISQGRCTTFNVDFKVFEYFRTDTEKRDFVSGGAAAGVSAAFGAPVGGVLFALEEGASYWNQSLTWRIFFASMISSFTLNVVQSYVHGKPWELSFGGLITFGNFESLNYEGFELIIYMAMGILGGLLGALFNKINIKLSIYRKRWVRRKLQKVLEAIIVAVMSALVAFALSMIYDDCQALGKDENENFLQVKCNDGEYSSMATMWLQTPEDMVKSLFHDPPGSYKAMTVSVFAAVYFLLATWTYGINVPSGLFIPCLLTGAAWGRTIGIILNYAFPEQEWSTDPGKFALIGAAAQLGGVVRMTISLTVILIEATGNISFGLPIMIVLMCAKWVGDIFNEGLYDIHIQLAGVPLLPWEPPPLSSNIRAREVMSHPVITFQTREKVGFIVDILEKESINGFPVVDKSRLATEFSELQTFGFLKGSILRSQLLVLLQNKAFIGPDGTLLNSVNAKHFRDFYPTYPAIEQINVSVYERECYVNLEPYMNPAPYTVSETISLPRLFRLFRGLGLRHVVVIDDSNQVVGLVARKDLARYRFHQHNGELGIEELQMSMH